MSWLATLTVHGLGGSLLVRGAVNRLVFENLVKRVLVPTPRPGHIVVLDKLSVHKSGTEHASRRPGITSSFFPSIRRI
jgi:hypothetical protein